MSLNDLLLDLPPIPTLRNVSKAVSEASEWLIDIYPDPVVIAVEGMIAYANGPAVEMFGGKAPCDVVGRSLIDFASADRYDVLERFLADSDEYEDIHPLRFEIVQLNGDWRIVETHAKEITYRGSAATLVVFRDVTERRRTQEAGHALTNSITEGICRIEFTAPVDTSEDPGLQARRIREDARIQQTNEQMATVLGVGDRERLKNRPLRILLKDDAPFRAFVHAGYRLKNHELSFTLKDGSRRYVMLSAVGIVEDGALQHIWGSCIDVTERAELERRMVGMLEQQQHEIGRELHDGVGQILTGVNILGDVLCEKLKGNEEAHSIAKSVVQYAAEAAAQIRAIYQGLTPVQIEREHLVCLLDELVTNTDKLPNVRCRFEHDGVTDVEISDVKLHLYRIAQEAVNNALKHSGASEIVVSLSTRDDDVVLYIEDNGQGLEDVGPKGPFDGNTGDGADHSAHASVHDAGINVNRASGPIGRALPGNPAGHPTASEAARRRRSLGMDSMRYRANAIFGTLEIVPVPSGGTRVCCRVSRAAAGVPTT